MTYYNIDYNYTQAVGVYISEAQAKNYIKVEFNVDAEDTLIESITKAAEEQAETICNLCINQKDVTARFTDIENDNAFAVYQFNLPFRGTFSDVLVYTVYEGTETAVSSTYYWVNGGNVLNVKLGGLGAYDEIKVTYTVAPINLPATLTPAIMKLIGDYYVNRTNDVMGSVARISESTRAMLLPFEDAKGWL